MSCAGTRISRPPGTWDSARRIRVVTVSRVSRAPLSLRLMNTLPVLVWEAAPPPPAPVKPTTLATAGSRCTMDIICVSLPLIAWNEMLWSACRLPISSPVSWVGKKPLGMMMMSMTFSATVASSTAVTSRLCCSVQARVRP